MPYSRLDARKNRFKAARLVCRADECQAYTVRSKEIPRGGANLPRSNFSEAAFDLIRRDNLAIAEILLRQPGHLILRILQTQIELPKNIIARAAQFGRRRRL